MLLRWSWNLLPARYRAAVNGNRDRLNRSSGGLRDCRSDREPAARRSFIVSVDGAGRGWTTRPVSAKHLPIVRLGRSMPLLPKGTAMDRRYFIYRERQLKITQLRYQAACAICRF
jgi:hypothetical protein